ncbi:GGDEF domain-containing protein [Algiphilus aromaticivorans]|uniref:GGDEF domain-containing protein n=1 Tax=Algiphilus aromaticivorans TaxID=382454 RepID=UPI0005C1A3EA|nr:diguanylate cyclase [Algiphilus aromaticivorans]
MATVATRDAIAEAQRLRLQRMRWGFANQSCTLLIVLGLYGFGMLPGVHALAFAVAWLTIDCALVAALKSGFNLRLRDPSMTAAQIVLPALPTVYIMYHVTDPQARTAFLLMATSALLFGMFALDRRAMLHVGGFIVLGYLAVLAALYQWAPQRIDLQVEVVIVFAYVAVLAIVALLGSFIAGLRSTLRRRNGELREAMAKMEDLVSRDPLTRLPNRRAIMEQLAREHSRFERRLQQQNALAVGVIDADHFKRINDTWGHQLGDDVLCRISETLQSLIRDGDFVGRFGGEEFLVIIPETTEAAARATAERLRAAVSELRFPELGEGGRITVSVGMALHRAGEGMEATVKRADDALYRAKAAGRDCVVFAEP